ncbi:hypothetical protein V6N13_038340 [Hibiscus sabdariffa]
MGAISCPAHSVAIMNIVFRQGCWLSPFLFNFIGEVLNLLINKAVQQGLFSGYPIRRSGYSICVSHLQNADDVIIFCGASEGQCTFAQHSILGLKTVQRFRYSEAPNSAKYSPCSSFPARGYRYVLGELKLSHYVHVPLQTTVLFGNQSRI